MSKSINIKFSSFDHRKLDESVKKVILTINKSGAQVKGAIPLPTSLNRYIVNNSHHLYNTSKFTMYRATHARLIIINNPTAELMSILNEVKIDEMISTSLFIKNK